MAVRHWLASNGNWTTAADWTGGLVPGSTVDAVLDAGSYTVAEDASSTAPIKALAITIGVAAVLDITDVAGNRVGRGGVTNNGTLDLDFGGGDGGSSLTIGGTLDNTGSVQIGPSNFTLSAATTLTLGGLDNASGASFELFGSARHTATLTVAGPAGNSGTIGIGKFSVLDVTGGKAFAQTGGNTIVHGTLTAAAIDIDGGVLTIDTIKFTNKGTLAAADGGNIDFSAGGLTNLSGTKLTGGIYMVDAGSTLQLPNNQMIVTLAANLTLSGAGSAVQSLDALTRIQMPLANTLTTIASGGALQVLGGRDYTTTKAITDSGALQLGGGSFTAASLTVTGKGKISGSGTINERLIVDPGAVFRGTLDGNGSNTIELAGAVPGVLNGLGTTLSDFAAVTVDAGANWTVDARATALSGVTLTGNAGPDTLALTSAGAVDLSRVSKFSTINLAAGNSTATVTDKTLSGGSVTIRDGASGSNRITAAGDTKSSTGRTVTYITGPGSDTFIGGFENDVVNASGDGASSRGKTLTFSTGSGIDKFTGGFENDVIKVSAAALRGDTLTGGRGTNMLTLTTAGTFNLTGVSKFGSINLAAGNNTVTVADTTLSGGSVTIKAGISGNNSISAAGDTKASTGKALTYVAGAGVDSFTGGLENDLVKVRAAAVRGDTLTGGKGTNTLDLTTAGTVNLSRVGKFGSINLAAGNNTVTMADTTLSGGSVTIKAGISGNNGISAAGDTSASTGKTLTYVAGAATDKFAGGLENDVVKVSAAAVGGDTLTGGSGTDTLDLTTAGTFSLSGVGKFGSINLAAGNSTVTVTDTTLSGGSVTIKDSVSGDNSISAAGDTAPSTGKTLTYVAGAGADRFTGGFENDAVQVSATAVGHDTLTGGLVSSKLTLTSAGTFNLFRISKFGTINLAAGNNTVTVADVTLSGGSVTIKDGASGNNSITAVDATSTGKTLTYMAGAGADSFTGGFEDDVVKVSAAAVGGDTLIGGSGTNTLTLTTAGTVDLSGVGKFDMINLATGNSTVTMADETLSGGSVTIKDGKSKGGTGGDNTISAASDGSLSAGKTLIYFTGSGSDTFIGGFENDVVNASGDTSSSAGKTLAFTAGSGTDSLTGGFENDVVKVSAAAVRGDTLTGGSGTNTLTLTTAGTFSLSGVSKFGTINLAAGDSTVTVADKTLSGGSVTIKDGASGNNSINAAGDTAASTGKTLTYMAGAGADKFTGGFENDIVHAGAGMDVLTGGAGDDVLYAGGDTTMTGAGGANEFVFSAAGNNTITDFAASAVAPTLTTLVSFTGANGAEPSDGLIADAAGDLFGTTIKGGANNDGTVFEIPFIGGSYASRPITLVSFTGAFKGADGSAPTGLIADAAGNLFGTTFAGGAHDVGTVFEIAKTGGRYASTPTTLYSFDGLNDGQNPNAGLLADAAGDLFGTTAGGTYHEGNVFEIAKTGGTPTIIVTFKFPDGSDGQAPNGGLIADAAGDLFGTTVFGGANRDGTVFEIAKTGGSYASTPTILVSFNGTDGQGPDAGLIADAAGDLFGTTTGGGANDEGSVFEIAKMGGSYASTPTTLVSFNMTNGFDPEASLFADAAGNLFGTTNQGGATGDGTVFEIAKTGGGYASTPTTLVNFSGPNGSFPFAGLIADTSQDLFGTTTDGGANGDGTVFELSGAGTTNEIVLSNKGFALGLSGASTTPKPLPTGLFVSDSTGTFTKTTQRFAYGTTNGDLFYSASGTTASEHLVTALKGDPALTASHLFFIT